MREERKASRVIPPPFCLALDAAKKQTLTKTQDLLLQPEHAAGSGTYQHNDDAGQTSSYSLTITGPKTETQPCTHQAA